MKSRAVMTVVAIACVCALAFLVFRDAEHDARSPTRLPEEEGTADATGMVTPDSALDVARGPVLAQAQLSTSTSAPGRDLRVRVVSRLDPSVGLAGARVDALDGMLSVATGPEGWCVLRVPDPLEVPIELIVSAPGHATKEVQVWVALEPGEHIVELRVESFISGIVVHEDGRRASGDLVAIGWRSQRRLSVKGIESAWKGQPSFDVHFTRVDPTGRFRLGALDPDQSYQILCVGKGYWAKGGVGPVRPGEEDVTCQVSAAFGLVVRVELENGHGTPVDPRLFGTGPAWDADPGESESWFLLGAEVEIMKALYGTQALEGVSTKDVGHWQTSLLFFLRADGSKEPIRAVSFSVEPPGCAAVKATIDVPWLGHGLTQTVLPTRCAECFGTLSLGPLLGGGSSWNARTEAVLKAVGAEVTLRGAVDPFDEVLREFRGVPCGPYELRLSSYHTIFGWPAPGSLPVLIQIESDRTTHVDVPAWRTLGRAEIELVDQHGSAYQDSVSLQFEYDQEGQSYSRNALHIVRAPYRCALLPPADWAVRVVIDAENVQVLEPRTHFTVLPKQTTKVVVPIHR